jgi:hypothetical protein
MKSILVICFTDLSKDARVRRQIAFLKKSFNVTAIGFGDPLIDEVTYLDAENRKNTLWRKLQTAFYLKTHRFEEYYWNRVYIKNSVEKLKNLSFDLIIANDIDALPLALKISTNGKVVLDAHEYSPLEFEDKFTWRMFYMKYKTYLCRQYLPRVTKMITVCSGISEKYHKSYSILPGVLNNAPNYQRIKPKETSSKTIKIVHHGSATPSRRIENMIKIIDHLDDHFLMDFYLLPTDPKYILKLKKRASTRPRIRILNPLPIDDVIQTINHYDIGLYLLAPNSFNNRFTLPNKFFDFIQARIAIAIGPSPEMAKIVLKYDCGIVSDDFKPESLAENLNRLSPTQIQRYKSNADKAAEQVCFEKNANLLSDIVNQVIARPPCVVSAP